jgi:hypothetical protein
VKIHSTVLELGCVESGANLGLTGAPYGCELSQRKLGYNNKLLGYLHSGRKVRLARIQRINKGFSTLNFPSFRDHLLVNLAIHVEFVVDEVALEQVYICQSSFPSMLYTHISSSGHRWLVQ